MFDFGGEPIFTSQFFIGEAMLKLRAIMFLWILLMGTLGSASSYQEKPSIPTFPVNSEEVVLVDCFLGSLQTKTKRFGLKQADHPQNYEGIIMADSGEVKITVSLLKAENTISLEIVGQTETLVVSSYGIDVSYKTEKDSLSCTIFNGELEGN